MGSRAAELSLEQIQLAHQARGRFVGQLTHAARR